MTVSEIGHQAAAKITQVDRTSGDRLTRARARRAELRNSRTGTTPNCTKMVAPPIRPANNLSGPRQLGRQCATPTIQNDIERKRGVYWCPRCQTYPWGSGFEPGRIESSRSLVAD